MAVCMHLTLINNINSHTARKKEEGKEKMTGGIEGRRP